MPALAGTPIDKTVAATPNGVVHVSNIAGSVTVTTWNRNQLHIGGTLGADVKRLAVDKADGGVDIRVVYPRHGNAEGSRLVIELPPASHLHVTTVSADIAATGLSGPVDLQSVSGDVKVRSTSANLHAQSVSGEVVVDGSAPVAQISAKSINGGVQITGVGGQLDVHSVSGDLHVQADHPVTGAKFDTVSGDIEFTGTLDAKGNCEVHSTSGDVTLQLAQIPAADFDVSSFSGDISTDFGPKPRRKSEFGPGMEWQFNHGGNSQVTVTTLSGDIRVRTTHH
ncbi:MAG: DUF4097 family beta strand repeat-containing protein [Rhodanobacteraceae bacterium]